MKTNTAFLALTAIALSSLIVSSPAHAQDTAAPPPPPPSSDVAYAQVSGGGPGGPGPVIREGIGFLGFEGGMHEKTVTGAPFTATFSTESTQTLADGNQIQHNSTGSIARDGQGRTRREMNLPAIGGYAVVSGQSLSHVVFLNDPVAGTHYILEEDKKIAQQLPEPPDKIAVEGKAFRIGTRGETRNNSDEVTTSLGTQTIGGVSAEGTRYTRTIPAGEIGNTRPIVVVTERWYSADLQMVVMTKRSDPRSGDSTFQMTNVQRGEPSASLFQVPADYTVSQAHQHEMRTFRVGGPPPPEQ